MNLSTMSDAEQSPILNPEQSSTENNYQAETAQKIQKIKTSLFKQERERINKIIRQIRQATNQEQFLKNAVTIILQTLAVERVIIYRFEDNKNGKVVAESLINGWTPTQNEIIPCHCFGAISSNDYHSQEFIAIEDIASNRLTPYQKQLLERFQIQASLAVPILLDSYLSEDNAYSLNKVWGLLVIQQCSQPRQWQEEEINLLSQLSAELTRVLQPPLPRLQSGKQQDFFTAIERDRRKSMQQMLDQIRQFLKTDRVWVYSFNPDGSGEVLDESVDSKWQKAAPSFDNDCFLTTENCQPKYVVNDIYAQNVPSCLIKGLEAQEAKAYIAIPILHNQKLIGILATFQNSNPRNWQESEVELMVNYASKFSLPLQQTNFIRHSKFQRKQIDKILKQEDFSTAIEQTAKPLMQQMLNQVRQLLQADRVWIYSFNPDGSGEVLAESLDSKWTKAGSSFDNDCFLTAENCQSQYVVNDIYSKGFPLCLIAALEAIEARAYIAIPVKAGGKLLGILAVFQNSDTRYWQESDIQLMHKYAAKFSLPMQQTSLIRHSQFQAKRLEKFSRSDIVTALDQDVNQSMQQILHQIRQFLKADRVLIYGFNPDGSGEVLSESVDSKWTKASNSFDNDCFLTAENCQSKYVVNDIYAQDFAPCLIEQLEALEAKAYIVIPVKSGARLLGVLAVYQNSSTRNWQESEVELMVNYAAKFSPPLQQTSFIRVSRFQAKQLEKSSDQDFLTSINQDAQKLMQNWLDKIRQSMKLDRTVVYSFNLDWSGEILAESYNSNWNPAGSLLDQDFHFKGGEFEPYYIANDVQAKGLALAVLEKFEQMQARAYIVVPIQVNNQLLGLLGVYQNSGPRNWQESEIKQVREFASRFILPLQQTTYLRRTKFQTKQMEKAFVRQTSLSKILEKVRLSKDEQAVFQIATNEGRKILDVDRVAIYRFNQDWSGNFIAESTAPGWSNLLDIIPFIEDTFLKDTKGGRYKNGESFTVEDIYLAGHKQCHIELLEQMEARAYVLAPIFIADSNMFGSKKLWGLIGCYQNSGARRWQSHEVDTLRQLGLQIGIAMQQINYMNRLQKQAEQEKASNKIIEQIRKAFDIDEIFTVATQEIRRALKADRTVVYQFNEDWSGQVVAESVSGDWVSLLVEQTNDKILSGNRTKSDRCVLRKWSVDDITDTDTYLQRTKGGKYVRGKNFTAVDDIYARKFPDCYIASLEKYQARAYIITPIFQGGKLWGLLGVYQNSGTRNWQESETEQMVQIANQLGIALQQADYVEQLKKQAKEQAEVAEQAQATTTIINKIRESQDVNTIFKVTTKEVRKVLKTDRTVIYQFNQDWSGQVIAESVDSGWVSLLVEQDSDLVLRGDRTTNERCLLRKWSAGDIVNPDSFLQQTQGGRYVRGQKITVVEDIYAKDFPDCYIESLEKYQAKAYIIAPIFQGDRLWGLLGCYHNSGTRPWQKSETQLMIQIASQLGIAIQQADYLEQIKVQTEELEKTIQRERSAKEQLQKQAVDMLRTVRPAFSGDLTVRATVTENEIGTIAGAYNTTLDSLKDIVMQVQTAVEQVAQTTGNSSNAVQGLSHQSQQQLQELQQALAQIQAMSDASAITTKNAQQVESAIEQADLTVQEGDRAMNNTVDSILGIRQTVADAVKRVKRLSDSSQKISRVVNLIGSFATQTNLLALNAALEATRAGEYGKGFAVVADEVRNLSLQSSEATTEIEKLVREIQEETQEVALAMDAGIEQVSQGTSLVNQTRESLNAIVTATAEIRHLVQDITSAANAQTEQAESVTQVMGQVADIANETSTGSQNISASFQELQQLAQNLQSSVAQFKVK